MKKRVLIFAGAFVLVGLIAGGVYLARFVGYQKAINGLRFQDIAVKSVPDGTYTGESNVDFIYAKVAVTVSAGVMTRIELLEHRNDRGAPAEAIVDDILHRQSIRVDAVTGATNSSRVIQKAIENALRSGA